MKNTNWVEPEKITAGQAWRRWLARGFDSSLFNNIFTFVLLGLTISVVLYMCNSLKDMPDQIDQLHAKLIRLLIELLSNIRYRFGWFICWCIVSVFFVNILHALWNATCIACFGNTAGKELWGIKVLHRDGRSITFKDEFKREMLIFLKIYCLGIPIIFLYTSYRAYKNLRKNKITSWDKQMNLKVMYRIQPLWLVLAYIMTSAGIFYRFTIVKILFKLGCSVT